MCKKYHGSLLPQFLARTSNECIFVCMCLMLDSRALNNLTFPNKANGTLQLACLNFSFLGGLPPPQTSQIELDSIDFQIHLSFLAVISRYTGDSL